MEILRMDAGSLEAVVPHFDAYRVFYAQRSDPHRAREYLKARLEAGESVVFWAVSPESGTCMGFTQLYPTYSSLRTQKSWLLNDLFVAEVFRRRGVGEALIRHAMDFAYRDGATVITLETAVTNYNAQRLYEKIGFFRQVAEGTFLTYRRPLP